MSRDVRTAWCSCAANAAVITAFAAMVACDNPLTSALTGGNANFELSAEFTENPCKLLPVESASEVLKAPVADLEQMSIKVARSCVYTSDSSGGHVSVAAMLELESAAKAKDWFAQLQQKPTQKQVDEVAKQITAELDKEIDKDDKMAKIADAADLGFDFEGIPPADYKPVSGVGDEAVIDVNSGGITFRYGKYIFTVTAADSREPQVEPAIEPGMDLDQMLKLGKRLDGSRRRANYSSCEPTSTCLRRAAHTPRS